MKRVDAELRTTGTPPGALVIEITKSDAMLDPARSLQVLSALQARGVRFSIDDFGTGHSSLAYPDRLPVHEVKIEQVAEGVENDLAKSLVAEMGCDLY